jgi:hypothetical protein
MTWDDFWRMKWLERYPMWVQLVIGAMIAVLLFKIAFG